MNKSTKGALAMGAAAVLLLGGTGTLAFWSDSATVNGGSVTSGSLALDAVGCDATWVYDNGASAGDTVGEVVPGDAIAKSCTFTIDAEGDHLEATPTVPATVTYTTSGSAPTLDLSVAATYDVDGTPLTGADTITEANDGDTLTADIVVTFPYGDATTINANDTQNLTTTLDGLTVTLTQDLGADNPNV